MTTPLVPLVLIGVLTSSGVYLVLERNLTRMLLGLLLIGNAVNLLILTVGGPSGNPPIHGRTSDDRTFDADPLAQGMILTAIVITMGVAAFVLSLAYRSYRITTEEEVGPDPEDERVAHRSEEDIEQDVAHPRAPRGADEPAELDELPESAPPPSRSALPRKREVPPARREPR
jgi:multicomponent Na+:H+ antiporter subunit C